MSKKYNKILYYMLKLLYSGGSITVQWRLLLHGGGSVCLANLAGLCLHSGDSWCPGVPSFGRGGSRATTFPVFNRVPFSSFSHLRYLLKFKCSALRCSLASTEFSSFNPIAAGLFLPNFRGGGVFRPPPYYVLSQTFQGLFIKKNQSSNFNSKGAREDVTSCKCDKKNFKNKYFYF